MVHFGMLQLYSTLSRGGFTTLYPPSPALSVSRRITVFIIQEDIYDIKMVMT